MAGKGGLARIDARILIEAQARTIARHGGAPGLRDAGRLDAALDRPLTVMGYEEQATPGRLAASVAHAIITGHPFVDGNKRAGLLALAMELRLHGLRLDASQRDVYAAISGVAAGRMGEEALAAFVDAHLIPWNG